MIKRLSLFVSASLLMIFGAYAQEGEFKFKEESFDFGTIQEGVQAQHEFEFTNTGSTPIVITNVRASCGCTTPNWTKEPVAPGKKGVIKASYNSNGRPGVFNKSITITSNATETRKVLYIKGVVDRVEEKPEYSTEELKNSPVFNVDKSSYHFGKVERGQKVSKEFTVKNKGKNALTVVKGQSACNCVTFKLIPESIDPGKEGKLEVIYSPYKDGVNKDIITIISNDLNNPKTNIVLSAEVVESLSKQSPLKESNSSPFK